MDLGLKGKVVGLAGGTSGIGEEIAKGFAREGCKVAVCSNSAALNEAAKEDFEKEGLDVFIVEADVSKNVDIENFIEKIVEKYGRLDVFVNNVGVAVRKPFDEVTEEEWQKVVNINFKSAYYGTALAGKQMKKNGGGVIINTSSFTSLMPTAGNAVYCCTKAAIDQLTKVAATELAADNIRVVSVQPGMTVTPLTKDNIEKNHDKLVAAIPLKRLAQPKDMVAAYIFLASEPASYINGIGIPVAGGKYSTQNPHYAYRDKGAQW